jgi:MscS family membrane protein
MQHLIAAHNYPDAAEMRSGIIGGRVLLVVAFLAMAMMVIPIAALAQPTGAQVFDVDTYHKSMTAGETATFKWSIFNGGNSSLLVDTYAGAPEDYLTVRTAPSFLVVKPGDSAVVMLAVSASKTIPASDHSFVVSLNITRMDDPASEMIVVKEASLHVASFYGEEARYNKILGEFENPLPAPFNDSYVTFTISVLLWVAFAGAFIMLLIPTVKYLTRKTDTQMDDILLKVSKWPIFIVIMGYGVKTSLEILAIPRDWIQGIEDGYFIITMLVLTWWAYVVFSGIVLEHGRTVAARSETEYDDVVINVAEKLGAIIIPIVGLTIVLYRLGFDITALLATLGFMGMVIGLAAKPTLSNFFGGMEIMVDRPYKPGDLIRVDGGGVLQVLKVGMRSTRLYDNDDATVAVVPNNIMAMKRVTNVVRPDRKMRLRVDLHIPYDADVEKVKGILLDAAIEIPDASHDPGFIPMIIMTGFNDSWLDFVCYIWVDEVKVRKKAVSDYRERAFAKLRKAGIEIPYPRVDAELHNAST